MPSYYSDNLRIELIGTGEQSGTWGATTNTNLGTLIESAICGYVSVTVSGSVQALTAQNGTADQARNMVVNLNGTLTDDFTLCIPPVEKYYVIRNSTTQTAGKTFEISAATTVGGSTPNAGTKVTVPTGKTMIVFCDGFDVSEAVNYVTNMSADTLTLTTPLPAASGGLPTQTNFASCFLSTDGTTAFWGVTGVKTALVATTANITLSGLQTIDGVSLVAGNRVLVKDQTNAAQNGIYVVVDPGSWTRAKDFDYDLEIAGSIVNVQAGSANGGKQFATTFKAGQTLGADNMVWVSIEPLPSQTSQSNKVLTTNGTATSWTSPAAKTVRAATTANVTLSGGAPSTVDSVSLSLNDRVLVKNQATTTENGIYYVSTVGTGSNGTWTRAEDANTAAEIASSVVIVQEGATLGGTQWATTFKASDTLGPGGTAMSWNQLSTTGTIPVSQGGTGLTTIPAKSILVADVLNTLTTLTPAAGQSIRINAGNTAWEVYTPSTGSTGLPSTGGTGIVAQTGTSTTAARTITAATGGSAGITVSNGNGVSGNPTIGIDTSKVVTSVNSVAPTSGNVVVPVLTQGTVQSSTSGTAITFTGIPSTAKRVTVVFSGVSSGAADDLWLRMGTSGGIESTGYVGGSGVAGGTSSVNWSSAIICHINIAATDIAGGAITLTNVTSNTWAISGGTGTSPNGRPCFAAGSKSLSGVLTQVQVLWSAGASFDAGSINILYE